MQNLRIPILDGIRERLNGSSDLPPEVFQVIAEHLEDAISATANPTLKSLSVQLGELFRELLRKVPDEAAKAVVGSFEAETVGRAAFTLGQLNFAHLLASQAAEHSVGDEFLNAIRDLRYVRYVEALFKRDLTGKELAEIAKDRTETVSRKLKFLRDLGVTDFRREGTSFINFLTPAAHGLVAERSTSSDENGHSEPKIPRLLALSGKLPNYLKVTPTFSHEEKEEKAA
jgi:DNA-binding transcriptional ArsR family regulator